MQSEGSEYAKKTVLFVGKSEEGSFKDFRATPMQNVAENDEKWCTHPGEAISLYLLTVCLNSV